MGTNIREDLSAALFGRTRRTLLALLLMRPGEEFYLRQIVSVARAGLGAVQRELATLVDCGIIERREKGRNVFYQANRKSPVFKELKSLLTKTAGGGEAVRRALLPLENRIRVAFLYGSAALGAFRGADSDIDLMVVGKASFSEIVSLLRPTEGFLGREINPAVYTASEFKKKLSTGHPFIRNVLKRPKIYLFGGERELAKLGEE